MLCNTMCVIHHQLYVIIHITKTHLNNIIVISLQNALLCQTVINPKESIGSCKHIV